MPREFPRSRRLEEQVQRILSDVVRADARDPRLDGVIITAVKVSRDLSVAWIYFSMLDVSRSAEEVGLAFDKAGGFLRKRLAGELSVRRVPELRFKYDDTGVRAMALEQLIDSAVANDRDSLDEADETGSADEPS